MISLALPIRLLSRARLIASVEGVSLAAKVQSLLEQDSKAKIGAVLKQLEFLDDG